MEYLIDSLTKTDVYNNVKVPAGTGKNVYNLAENAGEVRKALIDMDEELNAFSERIDYLRTGGWLSRSVSLCYIENGSLKAGILFAEPGTDLIFDYAYLKNAEESYLLVVLFHEAMLTIVNHRDDFPLVISCESESVMEAFATAMNGADIIPPVADDNDLESYIYYVRLNAINGVLREMGLSSEVVFETGYDPVLFVYLDDITYGEFTYTGLMGADEDEISTYMLTGRLYEDGRLVNEEDLYEELELMPEKVVNDFLLSFMIGADLS